MSPDIRRARAQLTGVRLRSRSMWKRVLVSLLVLVALGGVGLAALLMVSPDTLVSPRTVTRVVVREKVVTRVVHVKAATTPTPTPTASATPSEPAATATATPVSGPGVLGIEGKTLNPVSARQAIAMGLLAQGAESGVLVLRVVPGGAAARAGMRGARKSEWDGDVIQAFDGTPVRTMDMLQTLLADRSPGEPVTVDVLRAAGPRELTVRLGARTDG